MAHNASGRLAQQALELTRNKLLVSLRFMNAAFAHLKLLAQPGQTIATDGTYLRYSPADVARTFASSPEELARTYLHIMLHDVFLHPFPNPNMDAARWDAACDIAVEAVITQLALPATASPRAARQTAALAQLQAECPQLTAEALYRHFTDQGMDDQQLAQLAAPFFADDHEQAPLVGAVLAVARAGERLFRLGGDLPGVLLHQSLTLLQGQLTQMGDVLAGGNKGQLLRGVQLLGDALGQILSDGRSGG